MTDDERLKAVDALAFAASGVAHRRITSLSVVAKLADGNVLSIAFGGELTPVFATAETIAQIEKAQIAPTAH